MKEEEENETPGQVEQSGPRAEEFLWEKTLYPGWPAEAASSLSIASAAESRVTK